MCGASLVAMFAMIAALLIVNLMRIMCLIFRRDRHGG